MILESISLKNFRQYYGSQRIIFAKSAQHNVTVIHGENGSGKTALLNAFLWCLYGDVDLPDPDRLLNERAEAECKPGKEIEVSVILQFEDSGRSYTVTRSIWYAKVDANRAEPKTARPNLKVEYIDVNGKHIKPENPQNTIDQILPERLKQYFFFDGERIDNLSKESNTDQVQAAIKNLMGLEVFERALKHLNEVRRRFRNEQKEHASTELQELLEREAAQEDFIAKCKADIADCEKNEKALEEAIAAIEARLRDLDDSKQDQESRDELEEDRVKLTDKINSIDQQIRDIISSSGHLAFCESLLTNVGEMLEEKRQKGEIPAGIKSQFVEDLLQSGKCICGRDLIPNTPAYYSMVAWKDRAGDSRLEDAFIELSGDVKRLMVERDRLYEDLKRLRLERESLKTQKRSVSEQIDEISERLSRKESEEISALEKNRQDKRVMRKEILEQIGALKERLREANRELDAIVKERKACQAKQREEALAGKRANACEEASKVLNEIYSALADSVRARVQSRLDEIYGYFLRKDFRASLSESYELQIQKEVNGELRSVPMSQGERQITSLSFIGALVDIAREQYKKEDNAFFRGGIYPIVMDSPFGALDPDHRARIAVGIPNLAHQIVVLATDSQWEGTVEEAMRNMVGAEYTLQYYPTQRKGAVTYEYTEIKEGYHAQTYSQAGR